MNTRYLYVLIYPDGDSQPGQRILGFDNLRPTLPTKTYSSMDDFRINYATGEFNDIIGTYPNPAEVVAEIDLWNGDDTVECGCCLGTHPRENL